MARNTTLLAKLLQQQSVGSLKNIAAQAWTRIYCSVIWLPGKSFGWNEKRSQSLAVAQIWGNHTSAGRSYEEVGWFRQNGQQARRQLLTHVGPFLWNPSTWFKLCQSSMTTSASHRGANRHCSSISSQLPVNAPYCAKSDLSSLVWWRTSSLSGRDKKKISSFTSIQEAVLAHDCKQGAKFWKKMLC